MNYVEHFALDGKFREASRTFIQTINKYKNFIDQKFDFEGLKAEISTINVIDPSVYSEEYISFSNESVENIFNATAYVIRGRLSIIINLCMCSRELEHIVLNSGPMK